MKTSSSFSFVDKYSRPSEGQGSILELKKYKQLGEFIFSSLDQSVLQLIEASYVKGAQISVRNLYAFLASAVVLPKEQWNVHRDHLIMDPYCQVLAQPLTMINCLCQGDQIFLESLRLVPAKKIEILNIEMNKVSNQTMNIILNQFDSIRVNANQDLDCPPTEETLKLLLLSVEDAGRYYRGIVWGEKNTSPDGISPSHLVGGISYALMLRAESKCNLQKW